MKIRLLITALFLMLLIPFTVAQSQGISLERVIGGSLVTSEIVADDVTPVYFVLRLTGPSQICPGFTAGFEISSSDGAQWDLPNAASLDVGTDWGVMFDSPGGLFFNYFSKDGSGADTVGIGALAISAGLPADFDEESFQIQIGPIAAEHQGKTICLDSCFFGPIGHWMLAGGGTFDWDGPHCFDLVASTSVPAYDDQLPASFALGQNYPNPFNPSTEISFQLPTRTRVNITVYNLLGQRVKVLVDEERAAGNYTVTWNGTNSYGESVSSGVYLYKISADSWNQTKKMLLLK